MENNQVKAPILSKQQQNTYAHVLSVIPMEIVQLLTSPVPDHQIRAIQQLKARLQPDAVLPVNKGFVIISGCADVAVRKIDVWKVLLVDLTKMIDVKDDTAIDEFGELLCCSFTLKELLNLPEKSKLLRYLKEDLKNFLSNVDPTGARFLQLYCMLGKVLKKNQKAILHVLPFDKIPIDLVWSLGFEPKGILDLKLFVETMIPSNVSQDTISNDVLDLLSVIHKLVGNGIWTHIQSENNDPEFLNLLKKEFESQCPLSPVTRENNPKGKKLETVNESINFDDDEGITEFLLHSRLKKKSSSLKVKLTPERCLQVSHLNLKNCNLCKITNLQHFKNLAVLYLNQNKIVRIEGLSELSKLQQLHLQHNCINKIEGLTKLASLEQLHLDFNEISTLEGLEKCRNLSQLYLSNQKYNGGFKYELSSLRALQCLLIFNLSKSNVSDVNPLCLLRKIEDVNLSGNNLRNFEQLFQLVSDNYSLKSLNLKDNPICKDPKWQDFIVQYSSPSLTTLNDLPVKPNLRQFLRNKQQHFLNPEPKKKTESKPLDLSIDSNRPPVFSGLRSKYMKQNQQ